MIVIDIDQKNQWKNFTRNHLLPLQNNKKCWFMGLKLAPKYVHCSFIKLHEMHWRFNNPSVEALGEKKSYKCYYSMYLNVYLNLNIKNININRGTTALLTWRFFINYDLPYKCKVNFHY